MNYKITRDEIMKELDSIEVLIADLLPEDSTFNMRYWDTCLMSVCVKMLNGTMEFSSSGRYDIVIITLPDGTELRGHEETCAFMLKVLGIDGNWEDNNVFLGNNVIYDIRDSDELYDAEPIDQITMVKRALNQVMA